MAGLQQKKIKDSYKSLLRVDDDTHGIDGSLANITDGEGTAGPFQISSTEVSFPSSSTLRLANLKETSATEGFHINLTDSTTNNLNILSIPDNVDTAFIIKEAGNEYMKFTTTNSSERIEFAKNVEMQGNLQVNGTIEGSAINFNSVDMDNVDIDSGTIDGVTINNSAIGAGGASTGAFTTLTASGDVTISNKIVHSGDTDTFLSFGDDSLSLFTGNASASVVDFIYGNIYLKGNNKALIGYTTGGSAKELIKIDSSDVVQIGEGLNTTFAGKLTVDKSISAGDLNTAPIVTFKNSQGSGHYTAIKFEGADSSGANTGFLGYMSHNTASTRRFVFSHDGTTRDVAINGDCSVDFN